MTTAVVTDLLGFDLNINLDECIAQDQRGDAELFKRFFIRDFVYDRSEGVWYRHLGYWEPDINNTYVWTAISDTIAGVYLKEAANQRAANNQASEEKYLKRAKKLRNNNYVKDVIQWAEKLMPLVGTWDNSNMWLPCVNGMVDLRDGSEHTIYSSDYVKSFSPAQWKGLYADCPKWEQFIFDIFSGDPELTTFIQRLFGYAISGKANEKIMPILYGQGGNNGKTTLIETISKVLGASVCSTNSADVLMEVKFNNGGEKPSPFLVSLPGKRLFFAKESKEGQRFNLGLIKELTGGDTITGRGMYARELISFRPCFVPFLITNRLPHLNADDNAAWNRILAIEFENSFETNPQNTGTKIANKNLLEELTQEAPGILAWLVRGCLDWQREGLNPPKKVMDKTNQYREKEDTIGQYFIECVDVTGVKSDFEQAFNLYENYQRWCSKSGISWTNITVFGKRVSKLPNVTKPPRTAQGIIYEGLKIIM